MTTPSRKKKSKKNTHAGPVSDINASAGIGRQLRNNSLEPANEAVVRYSRSVRA